MVAARTIINTNTAAQMLVWLLLPGFTSLAISHRLKARARELALAPTTVSVSFVRFPSHERERERELDICFVFAPVSHIP